jgi:carbon-monoxide dehydrogenase small subunit
MSNQTLNAHPPELIPLEVEVNRRTYVLEIKPNETLLELLRNRLKLTGTKKGCDQGECGCCTVLIDNEPASSCLVLALSIHGRKITTVEALAENGQLNWLQQAFARHGAIQCGFCTSGMLLVAKSLLERNNSPSRQEIMAAIAGNICRCTGYEKIIDAIWQAAHLAGCNAKEPLKRGAFLD